jgi:hypothetical protein
MLIEVTLLGLAVLVWKKLGQGHEWTPEHEEMYQNALEHLKGEAGVAKLREIADVCEKNGHHVKAFALRARANLRATPANVKKERHAVYVKAMKSTNIPAMLKVAAAFEAITSTQAAKNIRARVEELQAAQDAVSPDQAPTQEAQTRVAPQPEQEKASTTEQPTQESTPRQARAERAATPEGLQQVQATSRTVPAPPPSSTVIDVVGTSEDSLVNGAGHTTPDEEKGAQAST